MGVRFNSGDFWENGILAAFTSSNADLAESSCRCDVGVTLPPTAAAQD
jgi:hypothetical protein